MCYSAHVDRSSAAYQYTYQVLCVCVNVCVCASECVCVCMCICIRLLKLYLKLLLLILILLIWTFMSLPYNLFLCHIISLFLFLIVCIYCTINFLSYFIPLNLYGHGLIYGIRLGACGPGEGELKIVDWLYTHVPFSSTARYVHLTIPYMCTCVRAHVYVYLICTHTASSCTCVNVHTRRQLYVHIHIHIHRIIHIRDTMLPPAFLYLFVFFIIICS